MCLHPGGNSPDLRLYVFACPIFSPRRSVPVGTNLPMYRMKRFTTLTGIVAALLFLLTPLSGQALSSFKIDLLSSDTTTFVNFQTATVEECLGVLIDNGGAGNYTNNVDATVILAAPGAAAYRLVVESFNLEADFDYLIVSTVNAGVETEAAVWTGDEPEGETYVFSGQELILRFTTDGGVVAPGFVINFECLPPEQPTAAASYNGNTPACFADFLLRDESGGFPSSWTWSLDGSVVSTQQHPLITVPAPGSYDLTLEVCNDIGCDTITYTDLLIYDPDQEGCDVLTFDNGQSLILTQCSGFAEDDGQGENGNYSNDILSRLELAVPGAIGYVLDFTLFDLEIDYDFLTLFAYDAAGNETIVGAFSGDELAGEELTINSERVRIEFFSDFSITEAGFAFSWQCIIPAAPTAAAALTSNSPSCVNSFDLVNMTAEFTDSWNWIIDGQTVSTQENPTLSVPAPGTWDVTLQVCNVTACDTVTYPALINYDPAGPGCDQVLFLDEQNYFSPLCAGRATDSGGPQGDYQNNSVSTLAIEAPEAYGYVLDFAQFSLENDADTLTITTFDEEGNETGENAYTGTELNGQELTLTAARIELIFTTDFSVTRAGFDFTWQCLLPAVPVAAFSDAPNLCSNQLVLNDRSTGGFLTYSWLLDGQEVSSLPNPIISLPDGGTYDITLITCNDLGCDTLTRTDYVTYDPANASDCADVVLGQENEAFTSACQLTITDGPGNYANFINSTLFVEAPNAIGYDIFVNSFNTEIDYDSVTILIPDETGEFIYFTSLQGEVGFQIINVPAGRMAVNFSSDESVTRPGFELFYVCKEASLVTAGYNLLPCGGNVNFFASSDVPGFTYSWDVLSDAVSLTGDNVFFSYSLDGVYEVVLTATGPDTTIVQTLFVPVTNVTIPYVTLPANIVGGVPTTLTLDNDDPTQYTSISWFIDGILRGVGPEFTYTFPAVGSYELEVVTVHSDNCNDAITYTVTVGTVGTREPLAAEGLLLFPNPATDRLTISWPAPGTEDWTIRLTDPLGRQISRLQVPATGAPLATGLDVSRLPAGLYFLRFELADGTGFTRRFIKQ